MLTPRQNLMECIRGGNPDRYVNQYEPFSLVMVNPHGLEPTDEENILRDDWGVYQMTVPGQPGVFPVHDAKHLVLSDITEWRDVVKPPEDVDDPALWTDIKAQMDAVNRDEYFATAAVFPGVQERLNSLHGMADVMMDYYEEPEAMKELIDCVVDWELRLAESVCKYVKPDALFHHDDWGTKISTFMAPEMLHEFLAEPYKKIYGYYKDHGVEIIVHHSDTYGETIVPFMMEVGIDIWQGVLRSTNDIPKLVDQYGGKISFMGGIETELVDKPDWSREEIDKEVDTALTEINRKKFFIPCLTSGLNVSGYPGVYEAVSEEIEKRSKIDFA